MFENGIAVPWPASCQRHDAGIGIRSDRESARVLAIAVDEKGAEGSPFRAPSPQLHPLVAPQVLHFMQVPLRTSV